jgi:outer membrane protein
MHIANRPGRIGPRPAPLATAIALAIALCGCSYMREQPEIAPDRYAPSAADRMWKPGASTRADYAVPPAELSMPQRGATALRAPGASAVAGQMSLPALIDVAMLRNPDTRRAWQSARAAAAQYGISRAPYYPTASFENDAGYVRDLFQVAPGPAAIRQWEVAPMFELTYTLIDFGRRSSDAAISRNRLAAANFTMSRSIQDVVFRVQRGYYALAAAQAAVRAARQNVALAQADLDAVTQRVNLGLATEPARLLARERAAQAAFELESARTLVNDTHAALAVAIGVGANVPFEIESLTSQAVPKSLGSQVDDLIRDAVRERPDLCAQVAHLRAAEAAQARAHADWFPTLSVGGNWSEQNWWYNFNDVPVIQSSAPQYAALLTLKWDIFTGFRRLNEDRRAEAERAAQAEAVRSLELTTIAQVWSSYYDFQNALEKYKYAQALLAAADESYADNLETYKQGLSTIVELLTADRDLANARFTIIQATADVLTGSAAVAYSVGALKLPH